RGRYAPLLFWVVGLFAFLIALGEALLRAYAPKQSFRFSQLAALPDYENLAEQAIIDAVGFRPGDQLSTYCGLVGTGLMIIAAIYPVFRRIKLFRWLASNTMWFDFHLMAGTVGPMFIGLHSVLRLDSWVSAAFWSMVIVVISGFLGRYLYTQVPEMASGVEPGEPGPERYFQQHRPRLTVPVAEVDRELAEQRAEAQRVAMSPSVLRALWW